MSRVQKEMTWWIYFIFYLSAMVAHLNPILLGQILLQNIGQFWVTIKYLREFPSVTNYKVVKSFQLPFEGEWYVYNGGVTQNTSHSWWVNAQRYAYDFVVTNSHDKTSSDLGKTNEDYFAFSQNVIAPADGTVVKVVNGVRDSPYPSTYFLDVFSTHFAGNHIIIKHTDKEHSFIAHFKRGSIVVKKGDFVKGGQFIGLCGSSGFSTEPHIHYHLQDSENFYFSIGLPIHFHNLTIRDQEEKVTQLPKGYIDKDHWVSNRKY